MNNLITRRLRARSALRVLRTSVVGALLAVTAVAIEIPGAQAVTVPCNASTLVSDVAAVASSGGTLTLTAGCTYTLTTAPNSLDGPNAFATIVAGVTIDGNGATITRSSVGGTPDFRFFITDTNGNLTLSNLTLSNGSIPAGTVSSPEPHGGGAIINRDHLNVNGVTFLNNHSLGDAGGGAIDNHDKGVLSVTNSTFDSNSALQGGAIEDEATLCHATNTSVCGNATLTNSTFINNSTTQYGGGAFESQLDNTSAPVCPPPASLGTVECQEVGGAHDTLVADTFNGNMAMTEGGAIANFGTTTVTNSTLFNNGIIGTSIVGDGGGGGVQNTGTMTITSSTIAGNKSAFGADIHVFTDVTHQPGTTTVSMSIVSAGSTANCSVGLGAPALTDGGYNIDSGLSCGFTVHAQNSTNPNLGSLASNGGPTQTMALNVGSPAIDAIPGGTTGCGGTDQRGAPRPQNGACDIGAFEVYKVAPTIPSGLAATANGGHEIDLSWTASTSPIGVAGYDISREGTKIATVSGTTLTYANMGLTDATTYHYTVDSFDAVGNTSAQSAIASATTSDVTPPLVPTGLHANAVSGHEIDLSWNATSDNVGVTGYDVYRNGSITPLATVSGSTLTYADTTVGDATSYTYTVDAFDAAGNHSNQSGSAGATTPDVTPPSVPTGLSATTKTTPEVDVTWTASTDNVGVTGYDVFRNGTKIATVGTTPSYNDTGVAFQGTYTYTVDAFDAASNHSVQSAGLLVTVAPFAGLYTLDGFGGIAADDSTAVSQSAYWGGWQIARAAHVQPGGGQNGFLLDGYGGLHPFGSSAPVESPGSSLSHYWGFDIARDFAFLPDGTGGYVLDGYGGLHPFGVNGHAAPAPAQGTPYWGWDVAKKVVIFPDGTGGYVLDAYGGIHPFGIGGPTPATVAIVAGTGYWSWRAAMDIVLIPGNSGHSGYVLDAFGGLHPFHPLGDGSTMPGGVTTSYFGFNIARGVFFLPGSATAGYTLDGYGGIHPFGGAPAIHKYPYFGWDIARGLLGD